jgi:hypothetical protein
MTPLRRRRGDPAPQQADDLPEQRTTTKGAAVNTKHTAKIQSPRAGIFATLAQLLRARGIGASNGPGFPDQVSRRGRLRSLARRAALGAAGISVVLGAGAFLTASPAAAATPWWHLESATRPTYIQPGTGKPGIPGVPGEPEVQEITVPLEPHEGTPEQGGVTVKVGGTNLGPFITEPLAAILGEPEFFPLTAARVQEALEAPYGTGKVAVTEVATSTAIKLTVESPGRGAPIEVGGLEGFATPTVTIIDPGTAEVPEVLPVPDGYVYVVADNLGNAPINGTTTPVKLEDVLPSGLEAIGIRATEPELADFSHRRPIPCAKITPGSTLSCEFKGMLSAYDSLEMRIAVDVTGPVTAPNQARISGGGAAGASVSRPVVISGEPVPFGVREFTMSLEEEGGAPPTQAGAHPFQFTTQISLNQGRDIHSVAENLPEVAPAALGKDFHFQLPPGLIGNPSKLTQCSLAQFFTVQSQIVDPENNLCPASSAVGVAVATVHEPATVGTVQVPEPIFNLEPNFGEPARFGFIVIIANSPVFIDTSVRSGDGEDYGVTAEANNVTQTAGFLSSTATFWGVPGAAAHDGQRGWACFYEERGAGHTPCLPNEEKHPPVLFSSPTQCTSTLQTSVDYDSWADRAFRAFAGFFSPQGPLRGCNLVPFGPEVTVSPTERAAASPTGLTLDLNLKQEGLENQNGLAESHVKKVTVALPVGVTTNPSVANGLTACTLAQYEAEALGNQACPESSKLGEVEIESPLVKPVIKGAVYVARQHDNPANNLLSIYMVAKNPELGVLVRSAGAVTPNQQTGQLSTTFDELPQLPFNHFHFAFRSGQRAPLITPGLCGTYTTQADLYPYSNPAVPVHREATFTVGAGANGAACATAESQLPNKPNLEAGTLTPIAGAYSPFVFKVKREDGSQALGSISATLPEGLLGKLAGVTECSNAQIAQAESRSGEGQGALEQASPSCPATSQVGIVNASTGAGTEPYVVSGKAYLAGPYKGAPLSLAIITPAVVGPFDLGTIVVRTALYVNEITAQITAKSDPIPSIIHGLPTVVRGISLQMNRADFTLNPTSCDPKQIEGSATSTLGAVAPLQQRFQVGACNALSFKPQLKIALNGQTRRIGHPALKAVLTYPQGGQYANVRRALVNLPGSEFLDQGNLNKTCTKPVLLAHKCPKTTIYGKAKAWSPLLDKPLEGPVYLVGGFGFKLPALVAELNGQIRVLLIGKVDSGKNKGIRNTFEAVPDAPVSRFVLEMKGGKKYGLLENSEDICKHRGKAIAQFTAQNGKNYDTEPVIQVSCGKNAKKKGGKKK